MTDKAPEAPEAPADDGTALAAVKAEATAHKLADGSVVVPLVTDDGTVEIAVPPAPLWYEGAVEHLVAGRVGRWMELSLEGDELVKWRSVRKRYRDLEGFVQRWSKATGETPGESQGSSAS